MKKKIFISLIIILFLLMIFGIIVKLYFYKRDSKIVLMQDNVVIEYGNKYNPKIEELIDLSKYSFIDLQEIRVENNIKNEKDKDYPAVGEYEINVYYKNKKLNQKIEVKDTIAPEISINDNIEIPYNTDLTTYNFKELVNVSDLSEIREYNIDFSNVNSGLSGEYYAKIIIEDIYSNKTEKEFKIIIKEKEKNIDNSSNEQTDNTESSITDNKDKTTDSRKYESINTNSSSKKDNNTNKQTQDTTPQNDNKPNDSYTEEEVQIAPKTECIGNNHKMESGNTGKWFETKEQADNYFNAEIEKWAKQWENGEKTKEEYLKGCPFGYEVWTCPQCQKWTINFYYR